MSPVIKGPTVASFSPGTASVSYYLGRYDLLVKTEGEKGGKAGMEEYLCSTYFPVMKVCGNRYFPTVRDDGATARWEETGDFEVRVYALARNLLDGLYIGLKRSSRGENLRRGRCHQREP